MPSGTEMSWVIERKIPTLESNELAVTTFNEI